jgi:hypothetical protein
MRELENKYHKEYVVYYLEKCIILNQSQSENKVFLPDIYGRFTRVF